MAKKPIPIRSQAKDPNVVSPKTGQETNISVRKIENGYIVRQSTWDDTKGTSHVREVFSEKPPKITVGKD